ncbi:MAG: acyltransferase, partial [Candidatus Ancillula sp.]|nr:acyltransferase [Candidatus Ancillula sp.]
MRNYSLDSFRLFFAFFIVALHIPFVGNSNLGNLGWESFQFIGHLGVPFFFVVSGFFAYSSDLKKQSVRLGNQFKKILGLFVASYFLFVAYSMVIEQSFFQKISTFTPQNIFNNLIHGWPTFDPILWFLVAQLYIIGLRWLFIKIAILFKAKRSVFIDWVFLLSGIVGYGLCCLNQTYFPLLGAQTAAKLSDYLNFFTDGLVFYMVGYFVRKIDSKNPIQKVHAFVVWIVFIVSFFLLVGEYLLSKNILIANHQTFFPAFNMMQIIFAFALLVLLVKYPNIGKFNNSFLGCLISRLGAKVAVYIYIIHEMVYYILLYMIYPSIWGHKLKVDSFDKYFGICFITFLVALIVGAIYAYIKDEIKIAQKFTIENKSQVKTKVVRNNSMDIMRMVAAFLIVIIHAAANYTTKGYRTEFSIVQVLRLLAPVAVVYFFALAGYFIYSSSWQVVVNKTVKQIKKIA